MGRGVHADLPALRAADRELCQGAGGRDEARTARLRAKLNERFTAGGTCREPACLAVGWRLARRVGRSCSNLWDFGCPSVVQLFALEGIVRIEFQVVCPTVAALGIVHLKFVVVVVPFQLATRAVLRRERWHKPGSLCFGDGTVRLCRECDGCQKGNGSQKCSHCAVLHIGGNRVSRRGTAARLFAGKDAIRSGLLGQYNDLSRPRAIMSEQWPGEQQWEQHLAPRRG